jgi:hypothetical protein
MGTWGTAIFSDDAAADVREDFRAHIGDGLTAQDATAALLKEWSEALNDPDEAATFWLALAATQWALGRLLPSVRERALGILDSGADLRRWAHDSSLQAKRRAVLDRLRAQLNGAQPAPRRVPRQFRHANNWPVGSVQAYRLNSAEFCLMRVIGHHVDKGGTSAIVELLDWIGTEIPDARSTNLLSVKFGHRQGVRISQFMLGATSQREAQAARFTDTGIRSQPAQTPGGYAVLLCRHLDRHLAEHFGIGTSPADR